MRTFNQPTSQFGDRVKADDYEPDYGLIMAGAARRQQASQASKLHPIYKQSIAQRLMTFQQFQKPGQRNKILTDYGLEKIVTPYDPKSKRKCRRAANR